MNCVTVKVDWLAGVVKSNRDAHRAEYEAAFEGYRKACIESLEANLTSFRAGEIQRVVITEHAPEDHTKDYDRIIAMLNVSVDDEVSLSAQEFDNYVQDEWGWKEMWSMSNSRYLGN